MIISFGNRLILLLSKCLLAKKGFLEISTEDMWMKLCSYILNNLLYCKNLFQPFLISELQNEVENYKLQLKKVEFEKKQIQENFQTLQELVDSLTEQKLNIITEVDTAKSKIKALESQQKIYEDEINKFKADLIVKDQNVKELTHKLSEMDCEVISLKRQNDRLSEENEQLLNQLTEIEARTAEVNDIGLQQREQLKLLEERVIKGWSY